jgi:hypothetical protein
MPDFCNVSLPVDNKDSEVIAIEVDHTATKEIQQDYQVNCMLSRYFAPSANICKGRSRL